MKGYIVHVIKSMPCAECKSLNQERQPGFFLSSLRSSLRNRCLCARHLYAMRELCRYGFRIVDFVEAQVDSIDAEIIRQFAAFDNQFPRYRPTLATAILSEIADRRRFDSPGKLTAFAEIAPSVKQSDNFTGARVHMSKRGSTYQRFAIWLAASIAAFKGPCHFCLLSAQTRRR